MIADVTIAFSTLVVTRCSQANGFPDNKIQVEVMHETSDSCISKKEAYLPLPMLTLSMSWNINRVGSNKIEEPVPLTSSNLHTAPDHLLGF